MMTRRQKRSLRAFTSVLSCCALIAGFLIFTNISNTRATEPVVFADILEGAVEYGSGEPAVTLAGSDLTETMFSDELETFTMTLPPDYTSYTRSGASVVSTVPDVPATERIQTTESIKDTVSETLPLLSNESGGHEIETTPAATSASAAAPVTTAPVTTSDTVRSVTASSAASVTSKSASVTTTAAETTSRTTRSTTAATTVTTTSRTTRTADITAAAHETEKTPFTNVGGGKFSTDSNVYLTMFRLVNNARKEAGLKELWYSARVHEVCELRTTELTSYYSHNRPDGTRFSTAFKEKGINYLVCGENIAYGKNMFKTAEEVFHAWMDSPSHKENILNPDFECAAFGLSILKVGSDTYYYWSQEFAALP